MTRKRRIHIRIDGRNTLCGAPSRRWTRHLSHATCPACLQAWFELDTP